MPRNVNVLIIILLLAALSYAQSFDNKTVAKGASSALTLTLPNATGSVKFLATGDAGRGSKAQYELGRVMANHHTAFRFDTVILTGDNMYGKQKPEDYRTKFEEPYSMLLQREVKFYASLGNHDEANQVNYRHFNMDGKEYYRFERGDVSFYALNSNYMEKKQLDWLIGELEKDDSPWKIAFFHHPPYSSGGRHGSDTAIREVLHPLFIKYGVDVVFTGHDHFYERVKPVDGIQYFVTGAGGKIRKGDLNDRSTITAKGFDTDLSFMLVEVVGNAMHFQVISRTGATVDSGVVNNRDVPPPAD
jgi:hypothetical protein